jgi:LPS-assembly lipoprotein
MTRLVRLALVIGLLGALPGCGLRPVYAGGANGAVAQGLAGIDVSAISGREGWLVRNALNDRLGQGTGTTQNPRYRLDVLLDDQLEGLGLLTDDTIGRERRTLRARYQLVDVASGAIMVDATAQSDAGIDVVSSEYATIAAEQSALDNIAQQVADRIVTRLTLALSTQRP